MEPQLAKLYQLFEFVTIKLNVLPTQITQSTDFHSFSLLEMAFHDSERASAIHLKACPSQYHPTSSNVQNTIFVHVKATSCNHTWHVQSQKKKKRSQVHNKNKKQRHILALEGEIWNKKKTINLGLYQDFLLVLPKL